MGAMMAAGEMSMVCELIQHTCRGTALADIEKAIRTSQLFWEGPDGYMYMKTETWALQTRALSILADESDVDNDDLRTWLPQPDELIYIAVHEMGWTAVNYGAAHPALLCATLYATYLNAWDDTASVAEGVLAIAPEGNGVGFGMHPLARIEAWRLLACCHGARGNSAGACKALECAVSESQSVGYLWMEVESLRDMLRWIGNAVPLLAQEKVASLQRIHEQIGAVTARFHSEALDSL